MPIITVEKAEHLCSVLRAMSEGKTIQVESYDGRWLDKDSAYFYEGNEYRIKPEPVLLHYRNYLVGNSATTAFMYCVSRRSDSSFSTEASCERSVNTLPQFMGWVGDWQSIELKE